MMDKIIEKLSQKLPESFVLGQSQPSILIIPIFLD